MGQITIACRQDFLNEIPENVVEEIGHKSKMFFKKNGILRKMTIRAYH